MPTDHEKEQLKPEVFKKREDLPKKWEEEARKRGYDLDAILDTDKYTFDHVFHPDKERRCKEGCQWVQNLAGRNVPCRKGCIYSMDHEEHYCLNHDKLILQNKIGAEEWNRRLKEQMKLMVLIVNNIPDREEAERKWIEEVHRRRVGLSEDGKVHLSILKRYGLAGEEWGSTR